MRQYKELGYHGVIFGEMLASYGGRETARRFVNSRELQSGFQLLARIDRLDLSVEQIMLDPEFEPLFSQAERQAASKRLQEVRQAIRESIRGSIRMKVVWAVFNGANQCVAKFDFPKRKEAEEHAAKLSAATNPPKLFFVQPFKQTMEEM